jgi:hypothetical protein
MVKSHSLGAPPSASAAPARSAGGALAAPPSAPATPPSAVAVPPLVTAAHSPRSHPRRLLQLWSPTLRAGREIASPPFTPTACSPCRSPRRSHSLASPWSRGHHPSRVPVTSATHAGRELPLGLRGREAKPWLKVAAALQSWMNGGYGRQVNESASGTDDHVDGGLQSYRRIKWD